MNFRACAAILLGCALPGAELPVRISWGYEQARATPYYLKLSGLDIRQPRGWALEPQEGVRDGAWRTTAGGGDVDGVEFVLVYPEVSPQRLQNLHIIWSDLIAASDADSARRLSLDPAFHPGLPRLAVEMNHEATRGFSVAVAQLVRERAIWVPSLHVFVTAGEPPVSFAEHRKQLAPWAGRRVLDQVRREPEATYEQYTNRWEDMGNPGYTNPEQRGPGHIVGLTWDSAIPKFGIDRGAGVWNDYGNPDHFQFWFGFGDLSRGITRSWKGQRLQDGLPVIRTVFEQDGVRYEVDQFAYPLHGPPPERRGDIAMVLLQQVRMTELRGVRRTIPVTLAHRRQVSTPPIALAKQEGAAVFRDAGGRALLSIEGTAGDVQWSGTRDYQKELQRIDARVFVDLPARGSQNFVVKLPSPVVGPEDLATLTKLDYAAARAATLRFWSEYVARGAQFAVPEEVVNDLFRATLWHALRLPRRHGGQGEDVRIDLPYSNFAYRQTGTPWPVNQAVYVDYMLYDLRGYHSISTEELAAQFRNNQEPDGRLSGVANWLVYTPGMLYAVAQNYLLSRDRQTLDRLLPYALKAMDWCLTQIREARALVAGPLNDGTGQGVWAFNEAYLYAGLSLFGKTLERIGHPRAQEALDGARTIQQFIAQGFGAASARSPLVQLRDHTWTPYVPSEANTHGRILDQWYPTDVDTGAVHLLRLKALPPAGELADALLHDHEDNLFYKGWGLANEPVYNQQGTAYLLRDDPKAAIRTFYSYLAGAFSHSALEPVEHRWTHGQYFGPPSTDGAWFELYRNMLVRELDDGSLLLAQVTPRRWLEDGKKIEVRRAPTYYGKVSYTLESQAGAGRIQATVELEDRPETLLVRFRHPQAKPMRSVLVNGRHWTDFDTRKEWVRIAGPAAGRHRIVVSF